MAANGRALTGAGMVRSTLACGGPSRRPVQRLVRDALARRGHAAGRRQRPAVRATRKRRANVSSSAAGAFPTPGRDLARRVPGWVVGGKHTP